MIVKDCITSTMPTRSPVREVAIRALLLATAFVVLAGCALLVASDRAKAEHLLNEKSVNLKCDMSIAQAETVLGGRVRALDMPDPNRLTHVYDVTFGDLWLVFVDGKLKSSQIMLADGLKSMTRLNKEELCVERGNFRK